jgi:hypothetical protein
VKWHRKLDKCDNNKTITTTYHTITPERRTFSNEFKAKVALEAIHEQDTGNRPASDLLDNGKQHRTWAGFAVDPGVIRNGILRDRTCDDLYLLGL